MIRVLITGPFKYEYRTKPIWLTAGESMYLDPSNANHMEEIKYLLSRSFPYKDHIHMDHTEVSSILECLSQEEGMYSVVDPLAPSNPLPVTKDPETLDPNDKELVSLEDNLGLSIGDVDCPKDPMEDRDKAKAFRRKELASLSLESLRSILLDLDYKTKISNKNEAIKRILLIEFGVG
jgi:hypothetical protein